MAITIDQAKALGYGDRVYFVQMYETIGTRLDSNGRMRAVSKPVEGTKVREFRVSGRPKTWKTRPNDVKVPVKYGLYDSYQLDDNGTHKIRLYMEVLEIAK